MCAWALASVRQKQADANSVRRRKQRAAALFRVLDANGNGGIDELEFSLIRIICPSLRVTNDRLNEIFWVSAAGLSWWRAELSVFWLYYSAGLVLTGGDGSVVAVMSCPVGRAISVRSTSGD